MLRAAHDTRRLGLDDAAFRKNLTEDMNTFATTKVDPAVWHPALLEMLA